jgi:hypothetical protein
LRSDIKPLPSREELAEILSYDAGTGELRWKVKPETCRANIGWNNKCAGKVAGTVTKRGYLHVGIRRDGKPTYYLAHRLIWKLMTGHDPDQFIDHEDGDKSNNRWANFRPANNGENIQNAKRRKDNKSGVKGVHWDSGHQKWRAVITANGQSIRLGRFSSVAEAETAISAARAEMHGAFARAA